MKTRDRRQLVLLPEMVDPDLSDNCGQKAAAEAQEDQLDLCRWIERHIALHPHPTHG